MSQGQNSGTSGKQWWLWFAWEISAMVAGAIGGALNILRFRVDAMDDRIMFGGLGLIVAVMGLVMQVCLRYQWPRWNWPRVVMALVGGIVLSAVSFVVYSRPIIAVVWQYQELRDHVNVLIVLFATCFAGLLIGLTSMFFVVPLSLFSKNVRGGGFKSWHLALLTLPTALVVSTSPAPLIAIYGLNEMVLPLVGLITGGCSAVFGGILIVYCGVAERGSSVSAPEA
jgi:hypothetical protein